MTINHQNTSMVRTVLWLPLLALVVFLMPAALASAESVRFTFDPPTPLTWRETVRTTRSDQGQQVRRGEITVIARNTVELDRQGDGYTMTIRPDPPMQVRQGREIPMPSNPMMTAFEKAVFTYELDADGRLVSVTGYEAVLRRMQRFVEEAMKQLPEEQSGRLDQAMQALSSMLTPEAILSRMRAEWDGRVADYVGAELTVGETLLTESDFVLPGGGAVRYFNAVRLEEILDCGESRCARVVYRYDTDPGALDEFVGRALEDLDDQLESTSTELRGEGERIIDPETMLIHSETQERTIIVKTTDAAGRTSTGKREEIREYTYDYGPASESGEPAQ